MNLEPERTKPEGTVLIVDDDSSTRLLAREVLEQAGFAVVETGDGSKALDCFDRIFPDIVLLDVLMPGVDGFTVCRQIREHPEGWNIPVLMLTCLDDVESIKRAYAEGATDYITKPCNFVVLGHRVRYMLRASQTLQDLSKSRSSLSHAQRIAQMGSWEWDVRNDILHWSEAVYRIFQVDPTGFDKSYQAFLNMVHPSDQGPVNSALEQALSGSKRYSIDHKILLSDGSTRFVHTEAQVVHDRSGTPARVAGIVQDITERKEQEDQIRRLAYYDSLTGLPNRVQFKENVVGAIGRARRDGCRVAIMFLDMDRFKTINDTMGHDVGDLLLRRFAERLQATVGHARDGSCAECWCRIARLGGDEFTVILDTLEDRGEAARVAAYIIEEVARPFDLDGTTVTVTVSIGISIFPDDGAEVGILLKHADIAMYRAKDQGRNNYLFFS